MVQYLGWERCPVWRGVLSSEVKMHARVVLGVGKGVLFREVSSVQRLKCMQEWYLGLEKVSCLERCPQFRG